MVGIYKITSPTNGIYIGQSWDIIKRFNGHRNGKKSKARIANSIRKHGHGNHKFEIIHELPKDINQHVIDNYEKFYLEQYKKTGFKILNLREAGSMGRHQDETKLKIKEKRSAQINAGRPPLGNIPWNKGIKTGHNPWRNRPIGVFKHSNDTKIKMSKSGIGKHSHSKISPENLKKIKEANIAALKGKKQSSESIEKRRQKMIGRVASEATKKKISEKIKAIWAIRNA